MLREINGYGSPTGRPLSAYTELKDDGSTRGGCWIYTGVYADGVNQAARRKPGREQNSVAPGVGLGVAGQPPDPLQPRLGRPRRQAVERAQEVRLVGPSATSRQVDRARRAGLRADQAAVVPRARGRRRRGRHRRRPTRSSCRATGRAGCSRRTGLADGPLPTHYEPVESPFRNPLYGQQANPTRKEYAARRQPVNPSPPEEHSEVFPFVFTTYRLTEHHTAGGMSRHAALPRRAAAGDVRARSRRSWPRERGLEQRRLGHDRHRPGRDRGAGAGDRPAPPAAGRGPDRPPGLAALPLGHRAASSPATRPTTCSASSLDPNVLIQESKVGTCDIRPDAGRPGRAAPDWSRTTTAVRGGRRPHPARRDRRAPPGRRRTTATRPDSPPERS